MTYVITGNCVQDCIYPYPHCRCFSCSQQGNNIYDQIAQRQKYEMEKRASEYQRKHMEEPHKKAYDPTKEQMKEPIGLQEYVSSLGRVDPISVNLPHQENQQLRAKAIELALMRFGSSQASYASEEIILKQAQRFYTYITEGE